MNKEKDYFYRAYALLLVVMLGLVAMYFLPEDILGWSPQKVDMLSDLRIDPPEDGLLDSTIATGSDRGKRPTILAETKVTDEERKRHERRQEVYDALKAETDTATMSTEIVDYSVGRIGLKRFFAQVARRNELNRPVRIAVLGDSFIEGDIFTDALRSALQRKWGGRGVGWLPMTSETAGFRQSVRHQARSWEDKSILHNSKGVQHLITGHLFRSKSGAWSKYEMSVGAKSFNLATIYYRSSEDFPIKITVADTIVEQLTLPASSSLASYTLMSGYDAKSLRLDCQGASALDSYGIALEGVQGISVDNMSLRGNSGLLLGAINQNLNQTFDQLRPYDLIILQYGLNVANASQKDYSGYAKQMKQVIGRLRELYPTSDLLLFGVSDRAQRSSGAMSTMPAILSLHRQQEAIARDLGIPFWSVLGAMRSLGGIGAMAERGQAAKDYTHLSHKGGRVLAEKFVESLNLEEKYYNAIED